MGIPNVCNLQFSEWVLRIELFSPRHALLAEYLFTTNKDSIIHAGVPCTYAARSRIFEELSQWLCVCCTYGFSPSTPTSTAPVNRSAEKKKRKWKRERERERKRGRCFLVQLLLEQQAGRSATGNNET
jgi:hypothetical protein